MTYYVVGLYLIGLDNNNLKIDHMLENMFSSFYLLFIILFYNYILIKDYINSKNNNKLIMINNHINIQSAENRKGFSETIRQLFNSRPPLGSGSPPPSAGNYINEYINYFLFIFNINLSEYLFLNNDKLKEKYINTNKASEDLLYFNNLVKLSNFETKEEYQFWNWFAGILDGDGNYLFATLNGKLVLKSIKIKFHVRDVRIMYRIQNYLHMGIIRYDKNKPYVIYNISKKDQLIYVLNKINGLIRIKVVNFKRALNYFNIDYIEADYNIGLYDPYFAGLIDTYGSILFNFQGNSIVCLLEYKYDNYTSKLNFNNVLFDYEPSILIKNKDKSIKSIRFAFQTVEGMINLYNYFMINRLYSDFKFYRVTKIKEFLKIRNFNKYPKDSLEFEIYSKFMLNWIKHRNPLWYKTPFINKLLPACKKEI